MSRIFVTIVSGLPRSGTSLMMQMLRAGGIPVLSDQIRAADVDNPRGYFEFEKVKHVKADNAWLEQARGKAVKIIHMLLMDLPPDLDCRVVFMHRDLREVVRSQATMLQRSGKAGASLTPDRLAQVYSSQLTAVKRWLAERPSFKLLEIEYADLIREPRPNSEAVSKFLGSDLDVDAMAAAVDPALYRNRAAGD